MFRWWMPAALVAATLAGGCAKTAVPKAPVETRPTAVVKTQTVTSGGRVPDFRATETIYSREDRQASMQTLKFEGAVSRFLLPSSDRMTIARLDRNLRWDIDRKKKTYEECALKGCADPFFAASAEGDEPKDQETTSAPAAPACKKTLTRNAFTVKSTGQSRVVNGFQAEEFQVNWTVVLEDSKKNRDTNTVDVAVWTTRETGALQEALRMQEAFERAYLERLGVADSPLGRITTADALLMLDALANQVAAQDRQSAARFAQEARKLTGYPISVRTVWRADAKACPPPPRPAQAAEPKRGVDVSQGIGGIKDSLFGVARDKAKDSAKERAKQKLDQTADKPILDSTHEVMAISIEALPDDLFEPAPDYKLVKRK
jgi:hypothetical protein